MAHVTFRDPATTDVEPGVEVGVDVELGRGVALRGRTKIGHGARIGDGVILTDTEVGAGVLIRPYCVATEAVIGAGATVGPFAHLRPGTDIGPDAHVGNFVETKKTTLGRGSKANHLTYLGDTVVGEKVNIGAGTITCNYDGYEKFKTVIDDGAFIGSDTQLVAPVRVGKGAVVGAGTTVTEDVPAGALAITRAPRIEKPGYAQKVAKNMPPRGSPVRIQRSFATLGGSDADVRQGVLRSESPRRSRHQSREGQGRGCHLPFQDQRRRRRHLDGRFWSRRRRPAWSASTAPRSARSRRATTTFAG